MIEFQELKNKIRSELGLRSQGKAPLEKEELLRLIKGIINELEIHKQMHFSSEVKNTIISELCSDILGYGPLQPLLLDPEVTEIMVNGPFVVYVEKKGKKILTDVKFDDEAHLRYVIERMLYPTHRRLDETSPYVDFSLNDGSRVNIIIPPLAVTGPIITIRKMMYSLSSIDDLIKLDTLNQEMADFLIAAIKAKLNLLFSGATGSGKTTTLSLLSAYIDESERIITIEDAREINLAQKHVVPLLTRPANLEGKGAITIRDLFINSLRMRPNRIILGEIRGIEAIDYIQAINSGHRGALAVLHASTPEDAISRLETMALFSGLNIPSWALHKQIASGLDLIIQQEQLVDGSRKITYITDVLYNKEEGRIFLNDIYRYQIDEVDNTGIVRGCFKRVGKPSFLEEFHKHGVSFNSSIFDNLDSD